MHGYLSLDIICSEKRTVNYEEQIMSKDKYPSIFSPQMEAIVFIILQIFFATRAIFKIGEYSRIFPKFSWGIFGYVTRSDQSRASEKIWWIIISDIPQFQPRNIRSRDVLDQSRVSENIWWIIKVIILCSTIKASVRTGRFYFYFSIVFYVLEAFSMKELFHLRLLDIRWLWQTRLYASHLPPHIQRTLGE